MPVTDSRRSAGAALRQIEANRLNALKSTGPKTEDGKQRSRRNALRHGFLYALLRVNFWENQRRRHPRNRRQGFLLLAERGQRMARAPRLLAPADSFCETEPVWLAAESLALEAAAAFAEVRARCDVPHTHQLSLPDYGGPRRLGMGRAAMHDRLNLVMTIIGLSFLITAAYEGCRGCCIYSTRSPPWIDVALSLVQHSLPPATVTRESPPRCRDRAVLTRPCSWLSLAAIVSDRRRHPVRGVLIDRKVDA